MAFEFTGFGQLVAKDPKGAAARLRRLALDPPLGEGLTGEGIAKRLKATRRTVGRWLTKLREALGEEGLGFELREGRRPARKAAPAPRRPGPRKKRRAQKKLVAN